MKRYFYLTLNPEGFIVSMLSPEKFGNYLAVGTKKRVRGQAIFFEVDAQLAADFIPFDLVDERCIPDKEGKPKATLYLSIYRVLELIPSHALKSLYLVTEDGRTLELPRSEQPYKASSIHSKMHLYQEVCPVTPRVASSLNPVEFAKYLTDPSQPISLPKIVFTELDLGELANDPYVGKFGNLPYSNIEHLRDCLIEVKEGKGKVNKTVNRYLLGDIAYRTCINGFFVGSRGSLVYYPIPSAKELEKNHYGWWRSAADTFVK